MEPTSENVIGFFKHSKQATVSFCQGRFISRIKKLAEERPDECEITDVNRDGSIVAHIPTAWIRINPVRELSEEQRQVLSERARKARHAVYTQDETT